MFDKRFKDRLIMQAQSHLLRQPPMIDAREGNSVWIAGRKLLSFASNDYLGLTASPALKGKVAESFARYGSSSSSSRLASGNYRMIARAEEAYARHFGYDDALFFPSGYQANLGIISALFEQGDAVMFDKHVHASSVKGMALSKAELLGYKHNSMPHLRKRLESRSGVHQAVITESLFSMDGDLVDLEGMKMLRRTFGFLTIVDEAHSFGALGPWGRGIARDIADIAVGAFGKAFALFGAFVLLPGGVKEYLYNFSSPLIHSTALPEAHAASALQALQIVAESDDRREKLARNSRMMKAALISEGYRVNGGAHIIAIEIGDEAAAVAMSKELFDKGVFVLPCRHPTVPWGRAILRISMTALHTEEDMERFIRALRETDSLEDQHEGRGHGIQ